jgi:hypothetical protein
VGALHTLGAAFDTVDSFLLLELSFSLLMHASSPPMIFFKHLVPHHPS